jgi:hypothetical protein
LTFSLVLSFCVKTKERTTYFSPPLPQRDSLVFWIPRLTGGQAESWKPRVKMHTRVCTNNYADIIQECISLRVIQFYASGWE